MKKLVLGAVLIFLVMTGRSQDFEGSIKMTTKLEITDPKTKAKLEEAKNDPATHAKIKEIQDKMNDPEFKTMLDANPQMKAQMEAMVKALAMSDPSAMMPSAVNMKVKGSQLKTTLEGGLMDKVEMLHLGDKNETYSINHNTKTYTLMENHKGEPQAKPKVTRTSETAKILNYNCTKYIVETTYNSKTMTSYHWVTTDLKVDFQAVAKKLMGNDPSFAYPDIPGTPLRTQLLSPEGTMTIETVEIKKGSIADSEFKIPSGYTEAKM